MTFSVKRTVASLIILTFHITLAGCVTYTVQPNEPHFGDIDHDASQVAVLWGLVGKNRTLHNDELCQLGPQALGRVQVEDNLGYDLLSVLTLGILKPMKIRYRCASERAQDGEL